MICDIRNLRFEPRATSARRQSKHGLTLVEIIVVVAIISLLASVVIGIAVHIDTQAKERSVASTFALLEAALQEYHDYTGFFPDQPDKIFANAVLHSELLYSELNKIPGSREILEKISDSLIEDKTQPLNKLLEIYDPWDMALDYQYIAGVDTFPKLTSAGPDKIFGNADDISNR